MTAKKVLASIIPALFIALGSFFLFKVSIPQVFKFIEQQSFVQVEAELIETNLEWRLNDSDKYIYTLSAIYEYEFNDVQYSYKREETDVRDTTYHYMTKTNKEAILQEWKEEEAKAFYIDPSKPEKTQKLQDIGAAFWALLIGLPSLFVLVGGLIIVGIFKHKKIDYASIAEPWLFKTNWKNNHISCSTIASNRGMIIVTVFWNLFAFTLFGIMVNKYGIDSTQLLLIIIFPIVGLGLLLSTFSKIIDLTKNGTAYLELDPFPGSIGGHFGGVIFFNKVLPKNSLVELKLNCVKVTISSGDDKSRRETLLWQTSGFVYLNKDLKSGQFRFDIPSELKPSDLTRQGIHWYVVSTISYDNGHFERQFEVPMYETSKKSSISMASEEHPEAKRFAIELINDVTEFTEKESGYTLRFPNFRILKTFLVFGSLLGGGLLALVYFNLQDQFLPFLFNIGFGFIGAIFFGLAIFEGFYTLKVDLEPGGIKVYHKWLGIPFKIKSIVKNEMAEFKIGPYLNSDTNSGKHTAYHKVSLIYNGKKTAVAIRLKNKATAQQMKDFFDRYYKL
ncbi:hypothetical protein [Marivirga sp.]|uniref:hypothetical protein n=1 Tax=Marivirga sp. TaxID=2018662 RepID=UPI002D7EE5CA|nr:hypothetical protein [Marivirga sp.]HET8860842.1 hypothetical protein [Marivirga sp.]